jgi:hypothetical protein
MLWAIDPDLKNSGVAVFDADRRLTWVGWLEPFRAYPVYNTDVLICEKPKIYPGVPGLDANDLVDLGEVVGWFRGQIQHVRYKAYYPHEWKGQVDKKVHHARIWEYLTEQERALFPAGTQDKIRRGSYQGKIRDILDACALGLFELRRTARGGTQYRP